MYYVEKTKALISGVVAVQLICVLQKANFLMTRLECTWCI